MRFIDEDAMKDKHGIYKITNIVNGCVYIGKTTRRFIQRYWEHNRNLIENCHFNIHLQNSWNKYGDDSFEFSVVEIVDNDDSNKINELEIHYIQMARNNGNCYNVSDGGDGACGVSLSEEAKKRIGEKNRIHMLGKKLSEETKQKMSEMRKGKYYNKSSYKLSDKQAFEIKERLIAGNKPSDIANDLNIDYRYVNNILSNDTWSHVHVDGWNEWRNNRKIWTRLTPEDHKEIYRLYIEEGYTKYELADMYHKGVKMIEKIFRECRKSIEQNEQDNHMTIQCQAS